MRTLSELITKQAVLNTLDFAGNALDEDRTVEKYKELLTECIKVLPTAENKGDLISRQAVLNKLEKWDWQELYLPIHFKQILDDVPSVENKGEWIPVSERLPEENTKVYLACCDDGYISSIMYDSGRWLINGTNIIAWMPLPEPYKGERE